MSESCPVCCSPLGRYPRLLANRPWLVISVIFVLSTACMLFCLLTYGPPNFKLSHKDFLTVNTDYSARMIQVSSLINNGKKFPNYIVEDSGRWKENGSHRADRLARNAARTSEGTEDAGKTDETAERLRQLGHLDAEPRSLLENLAVVYSLSDAYIADQQAAARAGNSSSGTGGSGPAPSVMDFVPMRSICELEERLAESPAYKDKCFMFASYTRCKPALSLPNLAANLANLTSCRQLRPRQVAKFVELLTDCASYLDGNSTGRWQPTPARCQPWQLEAAYRLNLPINAASSHKIVQSVFQFPNNRYEVFAELERLQKQPQHHSIRVAGIYISPTAELQLYGEIVLSSLSWLSLAILGIALITWVYTESALLVAATLSVILCSLALAYAVCTVVSGSNSFSMLNSMAVVLAVGIGSDDVFVIASAWRHAKKDHRDCRLEKLLSDTLQHAGLSVTVTSLTTIAAFATNIISPIVAINSFAIYASLTVGFNLFFMLTVVPAVIVVAEQTCRAPAAVCDRLRRPLAGGGFLAAITAGCVRLLSLVAIRLRYLVHLGVVGVIIFCFLSVAYYPGLRFPRSNRRSLFTPDNPVEGYHARYAKAFRLQLLKPQPKVRVHLVWGVLPKDGRHFLSPASEVPINYQRVGGTTGELFSSNATRMWFERFCTTTVKRAPYIASFISHENLMCAFNGHETFSLLHGFQLIGRRPFCNKEDACCREGPGDVMGSSYGHFRACLDDYLRKIRHRPQGFAEDLLTFYFDDSDRPIAFRASYATDVPAGGANFTDLSRMVAELEAWFAGLSAETGLPGFVYAEGLLEWELRRALKSAVLLSAGAALAAAAVTFLLTMLNPLLALQSLLVLTATLCGTACVLLWLGWCVDLVECVILTSSFGLAVDFTLHYGVAFRTHREPLREVRAALVLRKTTPPITFAAATTCLAGVVVVTSSVYVARMTGVFLITVSGMAWLGACLVFPSVIVTLGNDRADLCQAGCPGFGPLASPCQCLCTASEVRQRRDLTPYASEVVREATDMAELSGTESSSDRLLNSNCHSSAGAGHAANNCRTGRGSARAANSPPANNGGSSHDGDILDSPVWKRRTEV
ncbi:hypothetical protein BOX15_Mlig020918g3 [Macrostomum lignano]|uniref:SSD domain-containing protein n=1 Tax=Macrostomum lignano TaxID=282301 RepID=A0A267FM71_9PLAT|nr:hypothetical protein BOX15_Mlig020918g3 [Macrostomum lignano]